MTWGLIWLMFALKIPLAGLIYIVWWAIKQEPDEASSHDDDGGIRRTAGAPAQAVPAPSAPRPARRSGAALAAAGADRPRAHPHRRALAVLPNVAGTPRLRAVPVRWQTCGR